MKIKRDKYQRGKINLSYKKIMNNQRGNIQNQTIKEELIYKLHKVNLINYNKITECYKKKEEL